MPANIWSSYRPKKPPHALCTHLGTCLWVYMSHFHSHHISTLFISVISDAHIEVLRHKFLLRLSKADIFAFGNSELTS